MGFVNGPPKLREASTELFLKNSMEKESKVLENEMTERKKDR